MNGQSAKLNVWLIFSPDSGNVTSTVGYKSSGRSKFTSFRLLSEAVEGEELSLFESYVNGMINSEELVEHLEDLIHDVEGNDGMSWSDEDHYGSFEETDFSSLEVW